MLGWFSAFRENGAPTQYGDNRTPVTLDTNIVGIVSIFAIPSLAYLIILHGIRRNRLSSTFSFLFLMCVGCNLLVSLYHPCWHRAEADISTHFKSFSSEKLKAHLTVRVGLQFMNISLITHSDDSQNVVLKYNERVTFTDVHALDQELAHALRKGLPYPILKIIEYLSSDGFGWGRQYRLAGYYTSCMLWLAFYTWIVSLLCLVLVPHMFGKLLLMTGTFVSIGNFVFISQIPRKMNIRFPTDDGTTVLYFRTSFCFQTTCFAALLCVLVGSSIWFLDYWHIYQFDTIFSARRYAEDSVIDHYRSTSTISSMISIPDQFVDIPSRKH